MNRPTKSASPLRTKEAEALLTDLLAKEFKAKCKRAEGVKVLTYEQQGRLVSLGETMMHRVHAAMTFGAEENQRRNDVRIRPVGDDDIVKLDSDNISFSVNRETSEAASTRLMFGPSSMANERASAVDALNNWVTELEGIPMAETRTGLLVPDRALHNGRLAAVSRIWAQQGDRVVLSTPTPDRFIQSLAMYEGEAFPEDATLLELAFRADTIRTRAKILRAVNPLIAGQRIQEAHGDFTTNQLAQLQIRNRPAFKELDTTEDINMEPGKLYFVKRGKVIITGNNPYFQAKVRSGNFIGEANMLGKALTDVRITPNKKSKIQVIEPMKLKERDRVNLLRIVAEKQGTRIDGIYKLAAGRLMRSDQRIINAHIESMRPDLETPEEPKTFIKQVKNWFGQFAA